MGLLDIPLSVRHLICQFVLGEAGSRSIVPCCIHHFDSDGRISKSSAKITGHRAKNIPIGIRDLASLLQANRQLYDDVRDLIYQHMTFAICMDLSGSLPEDLNDYMGGCCSVKPLPLTVHKLRNLGLKAAPVASMVNFELMFRFEEDSRPNNEIFICDYMTTRRSPVQNLVDQLNMSTKAQTLKILIYDAADTLEVATDDASLDNGSLRSLLSPFELLRDDIKLTIKFVDQARRIRCRHYHPLTASNAVYVQDLESNTRSSTFTLNASLREDWRRLQIWIPMLFPSLDREDGQFDLDKWGDSPPKLQDLMDTAEDRVYDAVKRGWQAVLENDTHEFKRQRVEVEESWQDYSEGAVKILRDLPVPVSPIVPGTPGYDFHVDKYYWIRQRANMEKQRANMEK